MNRLSQLGLPVLGMFFLAASSFSQTTIIDGTDGGDGYLLNGSFESGGAEGTGAGGVGFDVDLWQTGFNVEQEQGRDNLAHEGTNSLVLGSQSDTNDRLGAVLNTGHLVGGGETFDLSFWWRSAFNWDNADAIDWRLFTTDDNTTTGSVSVIASGSESGFSDATYREAVHNGIGTVGAASIGQELWVEFYSSNATLDAGDAGEFARVDEVNLTAVPEPSSAALLAGLLGLALVSRRRRS